MKRYRHEESSPSHSDALAYIKSVKVAFGDKNKKKYDEFVKVMRELHAKIINLTSARARLMNLFIGHTDLILGFNIFFPKDYQITLPFDHTGKAVKKVVENCQLPWDVLDIISKTLDFDDHFQFAAVCKNWRAFHKVYLRNFLASQEPLLVQISFHNEESYSFISIPDKKVYPLKMMNYFSWFTYSMSSCGYLIMTRFNNSFLLINPLIRRKLVIETSTFEVNGSYRALLAFGKCSEEFVFVVLCKCSGSLHVYQSRNFGWVTYPTMENPWKIVDFVVFHYTIYVITNKANIGVLSLNSVNINFLRLNGTPNVTLFSHLRLVSCGEQLLVVDFRYMLIMNVYKIDFSTMNYVKLESLGDIALFYASEGNCYALNNPNKWGYESDFVYVTRLSSKKCRVYSMDDKKLQKCITPPAPQEKCFYMLDWYFRHLHYEVDYSLVE